MRITQRGQTALMGMGVVAVIILVIVFTFSAVLAGARARDEQWRSEYAVWVKYTGNPQQLTFEEFKILRPNLLRSK